MTFRELGRALRALGSDDNRVKVLDVDHSATAFKLPQIEARVRVGVYYLRPPEGVPVQEMDALFDQVEGLAFRHKIVSGIGTDHMELLTPDEYADDNFSGSLKLIHIEGARKAAREQLDEIFDEMKADFDPSKFPHLDDFVISGYKPGSEELSTQVKLLSYDDDFRHMSQIERAITRFLSEGNLHREIDVGRHLVKDTKPEILLSSTAQSTSRGKGFLHDLAKFLLERDGGIQTQAVRPGDVGRKKLEPKIFQSGVRAFPKVKPPSVTPMELVNRATNEFHETLARMTAYKELELTKVAQGIHVQFPKGMFEKKKFEAREMAQLESVHMSILGSPGLSSGWKAFYVWDKKDRVLKIRLTTPDQHLDSPWTQLG